MSNTELTHTDIVRLFTYDPETGHLFHKVDKVTRGGHASARAGDMVNPSQKPGSHGYLQVNSGGRVLLVHRVIWMILNGSWPDRSIDHIDGNKLNNTPSNLRLATQGQQMQNRVVRKESQSQLTGAFLRPSGNYSARISVDGVRTRLGTFPTKEQAHQAYLKAKAQLHTFNPIPRDLCTTS
jgi:hypothetical protein